MNIEELRKKTKLYRQEEDEPVFLVELDSLTDMRLTKLANKFGLKKSRVFEELIRHLRTEPEGDLTESLAVGFYIDDEINREMASEYVNEESLDALDTKMNESYGV